MDEVKKNAIASQLSSIKFKITELDNLLDLGKITKEEYEFELQKISTEMDSLEEVIKCNELPVSYKKMPMIPELELVDYLSKHTLETNYLKDQGIPEIEIEARRFKEQGINEFLEYWHSKEDK